VEICTDDLSGVVSAGFTTDKLACWLIAANILLKSRWRRGVEINEYGDPIG
jgi:hypothetical protein